MKFPQLGFFWLFCSANITNENNDASSSSRMLSANKFSIPTKEYKILKASQLNVGFKKKGKTLLFRSLIKFIDYDLDRLSSVIAAESNFEASEIKGAMLRKLPSIIDNALIKVQGKNYELDIEAASFNKYIFAALFRTGKNFVFDEITKGLSAPTKMLFLKWGKMKEDRMKQGIISDIYSDEIILELKNHYNSSLESKRVDSSKPLAAARKRTRNINFNFHYQELVDFLYRHTISLDRKFANGKWVEDRMQGQLINPINFVSRKKMYWDSYSDDEKSTILDGANSGARFKYICAMILADGAVAADLNPLSEIESFFGISRASAKNLVREAAKTFEKIIEKPPQFSNSLWNSLDWNAKLNIISQTTASALETFKNGANDPFIENLIHLLINSKELPAPILTFHHKFSELYWKRSKRN